MGKKDVKEKKGKATKKGEIVNLAENSDHSELEEVYKRWTRRARRRSNLPERKLMRWYRNRHRNRHSKKKRLMKRGIMNFQT